MHTGSTDNYELSQFASFDKPAWLTDYNGDMRKIDAGMKGNADDIATLNETVGQEGTEIEGIKERLNTAEADIDAAQETIGTGELETEVKNLIGAANELLGLIHDNDSDITQLQQGLAGVGDAIDGVAQLAYTIANVYDSTQTYAVGSYAIYQNTLYKCITAITVGEAFNPAKWTSVKVMNEVGAGGGGSSYSAGVGIDITNNVISFDGNTAPYDNTDSGLSATDVQSAIDELASVTPSRTPDVTITCDGVKTIKEVLNELALAIDFSKVKQDTLICAQYGATFIQYGSKIYDSNAGKISCSYIANVTGYSETIVYCIAIDTSLNECSAYAQKLSNNGVEFTNQSSLVTRNGDKFYVYY